MESEQDPAAAAFRLVQSQIKPWRKWCNWRYCGTSASFPEDALAVSFLRLVIAGVEFTTASGTSCILKANDFQLHHAVDGFIRCAISIYYTFSIC
jgi:hypothetical protein